MESLESFLLESCVAEIPPNGSPKICVPVRDFPSSQVSDEELSPSRKRSGGSETRTRKRNTDISECWNEAKARADVSQLPISN